MLAMLIPALILSFSTALTPCPLPDGYMNVTSYTESGVTYTLAVDNFYYIKLDTLHFYYSVENNSADTVRFDFTTQEHFAFRVYPDTCETFCQEGCLDSALYYEPSIVNYTPSSIVLPPGDCISCTSYWHIGTKVTPGGDPTPGKYRVFGGLWDDGFDQCFGHIIEPSELFVEIIIEGIPVETEKTTWGEIKSRYKSN